MPAAYDVRSSRLGFLDYIAILIFAISLVAGAYVFLQNAQAESRHSLLVKELAAVEAQIAAFKENNIEKVALTQHFLADLKKEEITWSKVIDLIKGVTPEGVEYTAYVGRDSRDLSLSVETDSVEKVIAAIRSYTGNENFAEVFVPSVNKGITLDGERLFTFTINTAYKK